jgi:F0F1-type ATP synthase assembly protein I
MKIRSVLTLLSLLAVPLAGCNDEDDKQQPKQQPAAEVNRLNQELQNAKASASKEESAKSWWQTAATVLAVAAISLLIVGTIIGSAARHESDKN